jgi:formylglycine-generating enzyme
MALQPGLGPDTHNGASLRRLLVRRPSRAGVAWSACAAAGIALGGFAACTPGTPEAETPADVESQTAVAAPPQPGAAAQSPAAPARGAVAWPDVSAPLPAQAASPDGQGDAAVIVGIENYLALPPVRGAEQNAKDWFNYLTSMRGVPFGNVTVLVNGQAKDYAIQQAINLHVQDKHVKPGGKFWFVFIGHGAPSRNDPLLVAYDADQTPEGLQRRSLKQSEVLELLRKSQGTPVAIVDACFNGLGRDGKPLVNVQPIEVVPSDVPPGSLVLSASQGNEYAGLLPGQERPAFSYLALGALRGWADQNHDGKVTAVEVRNYARVVLQTFLLGDRSQNPDLKGSPEGLELASVAEQGPNLTSLLWQYKGTPTDPAPSPSSTVPSPQGTVPSSGGMAQIPAGSFWMGSEDGDEDEKRVHQETLSAFSMDLTEVTVEAYGACVSAGRCWPPSAKVNWSGYSATDVEFWSQACNWPERESRGKHPMNCVAWDEAGIYCEWAGKRLPTEAEWEYAARGRDVRVYPWGDNPPPGPKLLNACGSECAAWGSARGKRGWSVLYSGDDGYTTTAPVGSFPAGRSPLGLYDMAGNVWEWTDSTYCDHDDETVCWHSLRVIRGGSWKEDNPSHVRAADRLWDAPSSRLATLGFRCARD